MTDEFNPYAAPTVSTMHPRAAEWLRSTSDPSLLKVAQGLGLIYVSIIVVIISGIVFGVGNAMAAGGAARGAAAANPDAGVDFQRLGPVGLLGLLGILAGGLLSIAGSIKCLATPEETGAKNLITTSVGFTVGALVLTLLNLALGNRWIDLIGNILSLVGGITFILFLKKLAEFIGAVHLARRAQNILIALVVGVAIMIVMFALLFLSLANIAQRGPAAGGGMAAIAALLMLVLSIGGLVVFVMYANLINNLRKAIQSGGATYY